MVTRTKEIKGVPCGYSFLSTSLSSIHRLTGAQIKALNKIGISTVHDLLYYFPARYGDKGEAHVISSLEPKKDSVVYGKISGLKTSKAYIKKIPMSEAVITDDTGSIKVVWFNQPYIAKMIKEGSMVKVQGKTSIRQAPGKKDDIYFTNPKIETVGTIPLHTEESIFGTEGEALTLYPVYPETKGITSNWIYHSFQKIISKKEIDQVDDPIPASILKKYNLPSWKTAMVWIHSPKSKDHADSARKRFSFEEIFFIQLKRQKDRLETEKEDAFKIPLDDKNISNFLKRFSFKPTEAQYRAIQAILKDMASGKPMSRLLEGDVGSGKTLVAAATAHAVISTRPYGQDFGTLQVAYMAPTEILAKQHFESFCELLGGTGVQVGLITGSGCFKFPSKVNPKLPTNISRTQLSKWVENGEIPIVIGTHALISKSVEFKNLAYVIIDEQHRFGTRQRQELNKKQKQVPHLLSMTATPIPRTLALTIYGDLDLTLIDQMPTGRKPIITEIVLPTKRKEMYEKMKGELYAGRQAYVICPRISEPDPEKETAILAKSVKEEAKRLKEKIFPEFNIGIMHSKMTTAEKDKAMKKFGKGEIDILVSTSVIEVGVNVQNATVILIEGAERFGLSQLHQLRGRVLRSNHQAYCFILSETKSDKSIERLRALTKAKNGFELSELDLSLRGAGDLSGRKQWGISDIGMEAIKNIKMVEFARKEARDLLEKDMDLANYPLLSEVLAERKDIHME